MKELSRLKSGDLVYHKEYGQGIVLNYCKKDYDVHFVGYTHISIHIKRHDLFTEGDDLESSYEDIKFVGYAPWQDINSICVKHLNENPYLDFDKIDYVNNIKHKIKNIEITVKVNEKDVKLSSISEETLLKIRRNS